MYHADKGELQRLRDDWRAQMLLLGGGRALLAYVPVINLVAPAFAGLAFVHYMLETLAGIASSTASPCSTQSRVPTCGS